MACECEIGAQCAKRNLTVSAGLKWACQKGALDVPQPASDEWDASKPARGIGDVIAKVTSAVGIKPCGGCKGRQRTLNRLFPFAWNKAANPVPEFVTTARLMEDTKRLATMLPADTTRIVGVARSGLCAATMVAMIRHLPLDIARQSKGDVIEGGNGWRLTQAAGQAGPGTVVVIDDTAMTGNSIKQVLPVVKRHYPNASTKSAVVYCNPQAKVKPDLFARPLPWPHLLEWNVFNSVLSPSTATDFDGILCRDCLPAEDDDGPRYLNFLRTASPLYPMRKVAIPLIVTARLEKYRAETVAWLERHGMRAEKIIMGPWADNRERARVDIGAWKGEHFAKWSKGRGGIKPLLFVESEERQAKRAAQISGGLVVCPAAGRCFMGNQ
jgi:orotate phosphoribosyltransferase